MRARGSSYIDITGTCGSSKKKRMVAQMLQSTRAHHFNQIEKNVLNFKPGKYTKKEVLDMLSNLPNARD